MDDSQSPKPEPIPTAVETDPAAVAASDSAEAAVALPGPKTFAEFLESYGPDGAYSIPDLITQSGGGIYVLAAPEINLHCATCDGNRRFHPTDRPTASSGISYRFLAYVCKNCGQEHKTFALVFDRKTSHSGEVQKLGENPPFGPPTPPRVMKLVGEDRELFLKGRRAELRGLGIGAFAYYRRVVEEQKSRIIKEIGKVAVKVHPSKSTEELFTRAAAETRFSVAVGMIKAAIPESLLIDGHNPLSLLHDALSEGLHAQNDEECLDLAKNIRVVLTELAERISTALKEDAALKDALTRLLNRKSSAG